MKQLYRIECLADEEVKPPCSEAFQQTYLSVDTRVVDSPEKLEDPDEVYKWYANGTNHRVENGYIKRDFTKLGWFVSFKECKHLNIFVRKYKHIRIGIDYLNPDQLLITVRDGVLR